MSAGFVIRCRSCGWTKETTGFARDLAEFREIKSGCSTCGKPRRFVCPRCKGVAVMKREPS